MLEVKIDKIVPAVEVKNNFDSLVDEVENSDELYVLTKNGKPSAVLVGVHHLEKLTGTSHTELMDNNQPVASSQLSVAKDIQEETMPAAAPTTESIPVNSKDSQEESVAVQSNPLDDIAPEEAPEKIDLTNFPDDSMADTEEPDPLLPSPGDILNEDMPVMPSASVPSSQFPVPSEVKTDQTDSEQNQYVQNNQPDVQMPLPDQEAPQNQITNIVEGNTSGFVNQNDEVNSQSTAEVQPEINNITSGQYTPSSAPEPSILEQNTSVDNEDPLDFLSNLDNPNQNTTQAVTPAPAPQQPVESAAVSSSMPDEEMDGGDDFGIASNQAPVNSAPQPQSNSVPIQYPNQPQNNQIIQ